MKHIKRVTVAKAEEDWDVDGILSILGDIFQFVLDIISVSKGND